MRKLDVGRYYYTGEGVLIHVQRLNEFGWFVDQFGIEYSAEGKRRHHPDNSNFHLLAEAHIQTLQELTAPVGSAEGTKHDSGKPPLSLIPYSALKTEAAVMLFGAQKYDPWNWKKGMKWSRLLDAALRHVNQYAAGEDKDPESGIIHLAHARCCLAFLIDYAEHGLGTDDRFKG